MGSTTRSEAELGARQFFEVDAARIFYALLKSAANLKMNPILAVASLQAAEHLDDGIATVGLRSSNQVA